MPPQRRRRRPRRQVSAPVLAWCLLAANVAAGLWLSPLTAVRKVRVVGSPVADQSRLAQVLQSVRDRPVLTLHRESVLTKVAGNPEVESATWSPNVFGRAVLRVKLRQPVVRVVNSRVCLDRHGNAFATEQSTEGLPVLTPPGGAFTPAMTILNSWEIGTLAKLCDELTGEMPNVAWNVEVSDRGIISLFADSGAEVSLGSSEDYGLKLKKLKSLTDSDPELLAKARRIVLTAPEAPSVDRR